MAHSHGLILDLIRAALIGAVKVAAATDAASPADVFNFVAVKTLQLQRLLELYNQRSLSEFNFLQGFHPLLQAFVFCKEVQNVLSLIIDYNFVSLNQLLHFLHLKTHPVSLLQLPSELRAFLFKVLNPLDKLRIIRFGFFQFVKQRRYSLLL